MSDYFTHLARRALGAPSESDAQPLPMSRYAPEPSLPKAPPTREISQVDERDVGPTGDPIFGPQRGTTNKRRREGGQKAEAPPKTETPPKTEAQSEARRPVTPPRAQIQSAPTSRKVRRASRLEPTR